MEIKFAKIALFAMLPIILPPANLLSWLGITMILDLLTGVAAAVVNGIPRTSKGFRGTVSKFIQYGSAICIGIILANLATTQQDESVKNLYAYFSNSMIVFIIFIEVKSIMENAIKISPKSDFTNFFLTPIHGILSFNFLQKFLKKSDK